MGDGARLAVEAPQDPAWGVVVVVVVVVCVCEKI